MSNNTFARLGNFAFTRSGNFGLLVSKQTQPIRVKIPNDNDI
jgi:hypothetical protein